jgi:hypothetical protein
MLGVPFKANIYADDITIACRGSTMLVAKAALTGYLNTLRDYFQHWGLTVYPNKTVFQYFSLKSKHISVLRYE